MKKEKSKSREERRDGVKDRKKEAEKDERM